MENIYSMTAGERDNWAVHAAHASVVGLKEISVYQQHEHQRIGKMDAQVRSKAKVVISSLEVYLNVFDRPTQHWHCGNCQ